MLYTPRSPPTAAIVTAQVGQQPVDHLPVVVGKRTPVGAGEDAPLDDAVVRQRVVQNQVARPEQVAHRGFIRRVPPDEDDRVVGADEVGNRPLQLAVQARLAGHQAAGRNRCPIAIDRCLGCGCHHRVPTCPVVVAGEVVISARDPVCRADLSGPLKNGCPPVDSASLGSVSA